MKIGISLAINRLSSGGGVPPVAPPTNTTAPAITGTARVVQTLALSDGVWTGAPTLAKRWRRDGVVIAGATASTYVQVTADQGKMIDGEVTATNAGGALVVASNAVGPVASAQKTEADFNAHIATLATGGQRDWATGGGGVGKFWTTGAAAAGKLYGSSWISQFGPDAGGGCAPCRYVQHGLPSDDIFNTIVANGQRVYFEIQAGTIGAYFSVNRNGYESIAANGASEQRIKLTNLIRWDRTLSKAFQSNPSIGSAETEYTW